MIKVYRKQCGCVFTVDHVDKVKDEVHIVFVRECEKRVKESDLKKRLTGNDIKTVVASYQGLIAAEETGKVSVDVIETLKSLEEENVS